MATLYRINNWAENFENHRTRELVKLQFVCVPNKQDGDGYTELLDHENGAAHYGAWIAIVLVASKNGRADTRGMLLRDNGQPHDSRSLARMTRIKQEIFDEAIPRLVLIGWLSSEIYEEQEVAEIPRQSRDNPAVVARNPALKGREGKGWNEGKELKEGKGTASRPGSYELVSEEVLRDNDRLDEWIASAKGTYGSLPADADRLRVFTAAEHALHCGRKPAAAFVAIVKARSWAEMSADSESRAMARINSIDRKSRPPPDPCVVEIGRILDQKRRTATA
jgi:hypothetical protein